MSLIPILSLFFGVSAKILLFTLILPMAQLQAQ